MHCQFKFKYPAKFGQNQLIFWIFFDFTSVASWCNLLSMFSNLDVSSPKAKEDGYASALREQHASNGVKAVFSNNMDFAYVDFVNRDNPSTYPTFRSYVSMRILVKIS